MATIFISIASFMAELSSSREISAFSTGEEIAATILSAAAAAGLPEVAPAVHRHLQTGTNQAVRLRHEELLDLEAVLAAHRAEPSPPARTPVYHDVTAADWNVYNVEVTPMGFACGICHQPMQLQFSGSIYCENCRVIGCDSCIDPHQLTREGRNVTALQCHACHADEVGDF